MTATHEWAQQQTLRSAADLPEDFFEQLVTVDQAADAAGVTPSTVHNWISRGYVDRHGQRRWVMGVHIDGVRRVMPLDVLRADAEVRLAARGGLRKVAM